MFIPWQRYTFYLNAQAYGCFAVVDIVKILATGLYMQIVLLYVGQLYMRYADNIKEISTCLNVF